MKEFMLHASEHETQHQVHRAATGTYRLTSTLSLSVQSYCATGSNGLTCLRGRKRCMHSCGKRT